MRVLITGGSGFIGSHVADKLRDHGVIVRIYDLNYPTFRRDLEYYQGSVLDLESLRMALNQVDAVMHLAAVADVAHVLKEPLYAEAINVRGTINVLEAMRRTGIHRLIYGSTIWVYEGVAAEFVDEDTPLHPPSHLYTATKMASELYCRSYGDLYGLETTILRYGIPYGPRARSAGVVASFVKKALKGEPLTIAGDGSQYRRFVYVEDLAQGNVASLRSDARNRVYNLDGNERLTILQIAEAVRRVVGMVDLQFVPTRKGDIAGKQVSSRRAAEELRWAPATRFEEGLNRYVDWLKQEAAVEGEPWALLDETSRRDTF
jgi:UDP-glucose 4-epimerase